MEIYTSSEYRKWFLRLKDRSARAKINARLRLIELEGKVMGSVEPVGQGIYEMRFNVGPGYRVYFSYEDTLILVLLIGGNKSTQKRDIKKARTIRARWRKSHE